MPGSLTNDRHEVLCESGTKALIIKQNLVVLRDPRNRMALIAPPLLQLFLFSFTATQDVKDISLTILNQDFWQPYSESNLAFFG